MNHIKAYAVYLRKEKHNVWQNVRDGPGLVAWAKVEGHID